MNRSRLKPTVLAFARLLATRSCRCASSPMEAAARAVDVHASGGAWAKALLDNAARPSGALVMKTGSEGQGRLTPDQFERLKGELESLYSGAENAGRPLLLEGGLDWKAMGYSPRDMDFMQARNGAARDIALAFGVPPMLLGIPGDNTYSNYQEANRAFYRLTVVPLVTRVAASIADWWMMPGLAGTPMSAPVNANETN